MQIYKFKPILKQTIWGGNKIATLKNLADAPDHVGESWEVSGVEGDVSVVAEGEYAGMSLRELIDQQKGQLVGKNVYERYGNRFPLLIKFIDARQDLSVQVHPTDEQAQAVGKPAGKTEMWMIMSGSSADASLRVGLTKPITPNQYKQMVADSTICDAITRYPVSEGDCFFLPAGRIHSIGAGCLLLEIQQTSDITYRIFDYNRRDKEGRLRQLHTEEAAACIDYHVEPDYRTHYVTKKNRPTQIVNCPYFTTGVLDKDGRHVIDLSSLDSFFIVVGVQGSGTIETEDGQPVPLQVGETVLVSASAKRLVLTGTMKIVTTYLRKES